MGEEQGVTHHLKQYFSILVLFSCVDMATSSQVHL